MHMTRDSAAKDTSKFYWKVAREMFTMLDQKEEDEDKVDEKLKYGVENFGRRRLDEKHLKIINSVFVNGPATVWLEKVPELRGYKFSKIRMTSSRITRLPSETEEGSAVKEMSLIPRVLHLSGDRRRANMVMSQLPIRFGEHVVKRFAQRGELYRPEIVYEKFKEEFTCAMLNGIVLLPAFQKIFAKVAQPEYYIFIPGKLGVFFGKLNFIHESDCDKEYVARMGNYPDSDLYRVQPPISYYEMSDGNICQIRLNARTWIPYNIMMNKKKRIAQEMIDLLIRYGVSKNSDTINYFIASHFNEHKESDKMRVLFEGVGDILERLQLTASSLIAIDNEDELEMSFRNPEMQSEVLN